MNYFSVIAEFCSYPKTEDVTLDLFNFLQEKYPSIWEELNKFYADDCSYDDNSNPRMARYAWDIITKPEHFHEFLPALRSIWGKLTGQNFGICYLCEKENELEIEHSVIVSYDFAPVLKYYEAKTLDGAVMEEKYCCRECAIKMYQLLVSKANPENVECWA